MLAVDGQRVRIEGEDLRQLIPSLESRGYQVLGPILRDGAIVYDTVKRIEDLPIGWTEDQEAGRYRLRLRNDGAFFGYAVGPQSWKKFLHPPEVRLFEAQRDGAAFQILDNAGPPPRYAFLGARPCDLAAIRAQDRVLMEDRFPDPVYRERRRQAFVVAVNCTQSAPTCFCASLHTGPRARQGFDLLLTEIFQDGRHLFVAEAGSEAGLEVLLDLESREASPELCWLADEAVDRAAVVQTRHLDTAGLRESLQEKFDHPRWDQIAARCLSCANCTMVCPTCFCTTVEDASDVSGGHAERWRKWDSCFTQAFSYIHGGSVRPSAKARYRQWMTHKLSAWVDQFGSFGCVGCGRCITWCPVGIDITEEVRALRDGGPVPATAIREADDGIT